MRELSLFSGAGGGLLGTHHLLGWECIGYVEWDGYCQRVLRARIDDGLLPTAPIFGDVREFIQSGAASEYRGFADVVTAGFPCQPFSVAGKQRGADDERNMWPATIEVIRVVRPRYCLLENVPGLLVSGYFGRVLGDLAESGYDARWEILSACMFGAPHTRERVFVVADANGIGCRSGVRAMPDETRSNQWEATKGKSKWKDLEQWTWKTFPDNTRESVGIHERHPDRMDRIRVVGNGQIPRMVERAWTFLGEGDALHVRRHSVP